MSPPLRHYTVLPDAEFVGFCSFYIHRSSMCLMAPENAHHPDNPLRGLFKLLRRFGVPEV
jgi:DNA repair protein RAD5